MKGYKYIGSILIRNCDTVWTSNGKARIAYIIRSGICIHKLPINVKFRVYPYGVDDDRLIGWDDYRAWPVESLGIGWNRGHKRNRER